MTAPRKLTLRVSWVVIKTGGNNKAGEGEGGGWRGGGDAPPGRTTRNTLALACPCVCFLDRGLSTSCRIVSPPLCSRHLSYDFTSHGSEDAAQCGPCLPSAETILWVGAEVKNLMKARVEACVAGTCPVLKLVAAALHPMSMATWT